MTLNELIVAVRTVALRSSRRIGAAMVLSLTCCLAPIGGSTPLVASVTGLAAMTITAQPAHARCLLNGAIRNDIAAGDDCLEAQRTGCVRTKLTDKQYRSCLAANKAVKNQKCVIAGKIRGDLSAEDCKEAKATGCVKRLLTPAGYQSCLEAQPGAVCIVNGTRRPDLKGNDCDEAKATGCVRRLLSSTQYQACLDAQKN